MHTRSLCAAALVVAGTLLLGSCGDDAGRATSGSQSTATTPAPADLPASYRFVVSSTCGERSFLGTYAVVVRDAEVVAARSLDRDDRYQPRLDGVPTLADLLRQVETAEPDAVVELEQDADGVPTWVSIDHVPNGIDDEECYRISHYQPLAG
jgi:hypothetical protein